MTIADHLSPSGYQKITNEGTKYDSLQEAYDAYVKKTQKIIQISKIHCRKIKSYKTNTPIYERKTSP